MGDTTPQREVKEVISATVTANQVVIDSIIAKTTFTRAIPEERKKAGRTGSGNDSRGVEFESPLRRVY
ncbi:hypothetical protein HK102_010770 [Quaeritorhiza haematococci]|nr:hypothetical protein HK102_010770 [Quaeritorhiza haematococci]